MSKLGGFSLATVGLALAGLSPFALAQFETRGSVPAPFGLSAAVGDFNRDGKLDLAVAGNSLQVFFGNGDGTFQAPVSYLPGILPYSVETADYNRDGKLDLAIGDASGVAVLLGNGDGTFQAPTTYTTACTPTFISSGDFNGDHKLDLLVTYDNGSCPYLSIFLGNGDGTFQQTPINTSPSFSPDGMGIGDFNGDGKLDLAVAESFGTISQVEILLGNGNGTFTSGEIYKVGAEPDSVTVADFRGNGKLDLAVSSLGGPTEVLLGNGDGTFKATSTILTYGAAWVAAADLDGDGKPDLAVAQYGNPGPQDASPAGVVVALNNGDGTFQPPTYYPAGGEPRFVAIGDFNGDHKMDILDSDFEHDGIITLLNTATVSFSPTAPIHFPFQLVGTASPRQTVTLTNTGTTALSISSARVTGPFRESNSCGKSVKAGSACKIEVSFQPLAAGDAAGTISIFDNASSKPQMIPLRGAGTVANISPLELTFAPQPVGTKSSPQNITLTNQGTTAMNITQIGVGGKDYPEFSETNKCPASLNPGANCAIALTFDPKKTGTRTALLYITDSGGGSPQAVPLTGTGD